MRSADEVRSGVALYLDVFALGAGDSTVLPRLLVALAKNGGLVLGAYADGELSGFSYGFLAQDAGSDQLHHYSQMTCVSREMQGTGVGRQLKYAQRDAALAQGLTRMRWTFDPVRTANAHFNFDVLGATGRWFTANMYGVEESGRDPGRPTDRIIVEWDLLSHSKQGADRWPAPPADLPAGEVRWETSETTETLFVSIPSDPPAPGGDPHAEPRRAAVAAVQSGLDSGMTAVSCQRGAPGTAVYLLERKVS